MTIASLDQVTEFPLCWPEGKPRSARRTASPFRTTMPVAQREIEAEMWAWRAHGYVVSMRQSPRRAGNGADA